jgi:hypothetical protein
MSALVKTPVIALDGHVGFSPKTDMNADISEVR